MPSLLDLLPAGTELTDDGVPVVGGCRLDQVAAETATPVLVVAEDALRARAREYADGLAARWPRSRVVFASKAFPCTAVQRVMVEEGLGLDVAGGGEILGALKAGVDPRLSSCTATPSSPTRSRSRSSTASASWSWTAPTTSTGSRRQSRQVASSTCWSG